MSDTFTPQPNSKYCFVCGLESPVGLKLRFTDNGVDAVRAIHMVPDKFQGYPGVVHGGVVAAMLDETGGRAVMIGNPNRFFMTAKMEIRYRQPVPT
nr:PaaI family thioesterase [Anaerolineae bacterium]